MTYQYNWGWPDVPEDIEYVILMIAIRKQI